MIFGLDIFVVVFNWEFNGGSMPSIEFDHMSDVFVRLVIWHSSLALSVLCFDGSFWNFTFFFKYGKFGMICSICCHLSNIMLGLMFKIYKGKVISVYWILTCPFFYLKHHSNFCLCFSTVFMILPSTFFPYSTPLWCDMPCWLMPD